MSPLHADVDSALTDVLARATDQSDEFKRRFRRLIENSTEGIVPDDDIKGVIEIASTLADILEL